MGWNGLNCVAQDMRMTEGRVSFNLSQFPSTCRASQERDPVDCSLSPHIRESSRSGSINEGKQKRKAGGSTRTFRDIRSGISSTLVPRLHRVKVNVGLAVSYGPP